MAEKVGQKTNKKSTAGKTIYKTPEGEMVSEKSVTIKFGENAYVNAPSIHNGIKYTEDEIRQMLLDGKIKPTSRHDTLEEAIQAAEKRSSTLMAEGGVPMKKQMELFDDGGLMEEGGTIDPVSGNDVPVGSTQEEVRDDIPAQLSEGEFVFPADVVRYIGLEKLMQMRQEAKMGLSMMNKMGQMGNGDEAVIPDDIPFELSDLDMEDDMEYNVGGYVAPQQSFVPTFNTGVGFVPSAVTTPQPATVPQSVTPPVQYVTPQQTFTPTQPDYSNLTFQEVMTAPQAPRLEEIVNPETGERRTINYIPGVTQLPDGFVLASEYTAPEKQTTTPTTTPTVSTTTRDKDDDDDDPRDNVAYEAMRRRIDYASQLGYDVRSDLESLMKLSPLSLITGGTKGKKGEVINGYISDGDGNLYSPYTGRFVKTEGIIPKTDKTITSEMQDFSDSIAERINENRSTGRDDFDFDIRTSSQYKGPTVKAQQEASDAAMANFYGTDKDDDKPDTATRLGVDTDALAKRQAELAKMKADKAAKAAAKARLEKARADRKRKQDKKDREKADKNRYKEKALKEKAKDIASGGKRRTFGGFNEGGLASKPKPKPKQMRSGGLASRK